MHQYLQPRERGLMEPTNMKEGDPGCPNMADIWSVLPEQLKSVSVATELPQERHRWNTNEEVASLLIAFDKHQEWIQNEVVIRPPSGTMLFYLKTSQRYRKDGYFWKKRRDGKTTREDHMKLKVQGMECIYGCYVHSAILPTFHRRSYWLLQNPDMVLVHYLNVPLTDETPLPPLTIQPHKQQWTEDQLLAQLRPMFARNEGYEAQKGTYMADETIRSVAQKLLESQRRVDCHCSNVCKCNSCRACKQKRLPPQLVTYLSQRVPSANGEQIATKVTPHGAAYHAAPFRTTPHSGQAAPLRTNGTPNNGQTYSASVRATNPTASNGNSKPQYQFVGGQPNGGESLEKLTSKNVLINTSKSGGSNNKPLILNLSQLQGNNSLIILSSSGKPSSPMTIITRKGPHPQNTAQNTAQNGQTNHLHNMEPNRVRNITSDNAHHNTTALVTQGQTLAPQSAVTSQEVTSQGQIFHQGQQTLLRPQVQGHNLLMNNQNILVSQGHNNQSVVPNNLLDTVSLQTRGNNVSTGPTNIINHVTTDNRRHSEGDSNNKTNPHVRPQRAFTISDPAELNFMSNLLPTSGAINSNSGNTHNPVASYSSNHMENYGNNQTSNYGNLSNGSDCFQIFADNTSHLLSNGSVSQSSGNYGNSSDISVNGESAQSQMAESDIAMDFLIQELNMKNNMTATNGQSFSNNLNNTSAILDDVCLQTSIANIPMQISPSSPDLNLDDFVDLSFLEPGLASSTETPLLATGNNSHTSDTAVTMITTSSPISSVGDGFINNKRSCDHHTSGGTITDFCPEWAYTKGGAKLLVTGPWLSETGSYAVVFDGVAVSATMVQKGVLRCYCPDHVPGEAMLEVACNGHVISDRVKFEYRVKREELTEDEDWFNVEDYQLRTWLLERLQAIESCFSTEGAVGLSTRILTKPQREGADNLELQLIECVQQLSQKQWPTGEIELPNLTTHTLSLLHLSAALGYARLISTLIGWKLENVSSVLESEVDLFSLDMNECTPLAWSCARGHQDAVSMLYKYNPEALKINNRDGLNAIDVAKKHGQSSIANKLWGLEKARLKYLQSSPPLKGEDTTVQNDSGNGSLLLSDKTTSSDNDTQLFKVPASPVHSTPKGGTPVKGVAPQNTPAMLSIDIPQDNVLPVAPKSRKSHDSRRSRLLKRISVEVLPDYPSTDASGKGGKLDLTDLADLHQVRAKSLTLDEVQDERLLSAHWSRDSETKVYNDPMFSMNSRDLNSPVMFLPMESQPIGLTLQDIQQHTAMETESSCNTSCSSSLGDTGLEDLIDSVSTQDVSSEGNQGNQMATLANQIIAAIPERIKASPSRSEELGPDESSLRRDRSSSYSSFSSCSSTADPQCTEDSGISTPLDTPLEGIAFEDYRYVDLGTPASSHSPASSLHSPYVDHFSMDSPPPTTAEFNEYFNAPQTYMEKDFSQLTLSDTEQRKLYEAAKIIQNFFRRFKDRREQQMLQRQRELQAAILIQSYYRRYKQYLYYKKMTVAATLIQSQFRSYYAQKRFRQSREAATLIQNRYRAYKEQERYRKRKDAAVLIQQRFRNHYQRKRSRKGDKPGRHGDTTEDCKEVSTNQKESPSSSVRSEGNNISESKSADGKDNNG